MTWQSLDFIVFLFDTPRDLIPISRPNKLCVERHSIDLLGHIVFQQVSWEQNRRTNGKQQIFWTPQGHTVFQSKSGDGTHKWQSNKFCRPHKVIYYFKVSRGGGRNQQLASDKRCRPPRQWWSSSPHWVRDCACSMHHHRSRKLRIFFFRGSFPPDPKMQKSSKSPPAPPLPLCFKVRAFLKSKPPITYKVVGLQF